MFPECHQMFPECHKMFPESTNLNPPQQLLRRSYLPFLI
jgi:hypothetical protein